VIAYLSPIAQTAIGPKRELCPVICAIEQLNFTSTAIFSRIPPPNPALQTELQIRRLVNALWADEEEIAMRCVFTATGGFLGRIDGETVCAFWSQDPVDHGFDPDRLITVDLARTPSVAAAGEISWEAVQVDDCFAGPNGAVGGTTLGPRWPEVRISGAVYLERGFLESLPSPLRPPCPPLGMTGRVCEFTSTVYWPHSSDPRAGKRYAGHYAEILEERGTLARVAVYPPGSSVRPNARPLTMWIDLASPEHCDAGPNTLTEIGVGDAPKSGALFLISGQLSTNDQPRPKEA